MTETPHKPKPMHALVLETIELCCVEKKCHIFNLENQLEHVALDIMGPLNEIEHNNSYVLVIQDYFSMSVEVFPLPNDQAVTVAEVLASEWVCRYGTPQTLHSDQGRNFECEVFQKMCTQFDIEKRHMLPTLSWPTE